jgi:hypothetical protein
LAGFIGSTAVPDDERIGRLADGYKRPTRKELGDNAACAGVVIGAGPGGNIVEVGAAARAHPDHAVRVCEFIADKLPPDRAIVVARTIMKSAKRG